MLEQNSLLAVLPEIVLASLASLLLVFAVYAPKLGKKIIVPLSQLTVVIVGVIIFNYWQQLNGTYYHGSFIVDNFSSGLKLFSCIGMFIIFTYSKPFLDRQMHNCEYCILCLTALLGIMIILSSVNLLTLYLGIELLALPTYALVAMVGEEHSGEAAIKYFVLGAIASGIFLYGISLIYGITGHINYHNIFTTIPAAWENSNNNLVLVFAVIFIVVGFAFKLGAVPFHMWVPDLYQGTPTALTLFIASVPKIASLALALRILSQMLPTYLIIEWQFMLVILSMASIILGNVVALAQTQIKRMLAYSSISHVGFLLLALLCGSKESYLAATYYIVIYVITTLAMFGLLIILSNDNKKIDDIDDLSGLIKRQPLYAVFFLILLLSMIGIPPTAGFYAKFMVLRSVVNIGQYTLAAVAVFFSVIGAFYYLRVIRKVYFDTDVELLPDQFDLQHTSLFTRGIIGVNTLAVLLLGLFPTIGIHWCKILLAT